MIVFDLECRNLGHRFEGWFGSSADFDSQQARGLVTCPVCGAADVAKAVMAPNLGRKGNQLAPAPVAKGPPSPPAVAAAPPAPVPPQAMNGPTLPPEAVQMLRAVAQMQAEAITRSRWVGKSFADDARAMHYGEKEAALIHGQATPSEARDLMEEGIAVAPLLIPIVPPDEAN